MKWWLSLAAVTLLAGCVGEQQKDTEYTYTGFPLGHVSFSEISAQEARISFTGPDPVMKREAEVLPDRYIERIIFKNNAMMRYEFITQGGLDGSESDKEFLQIMMKNESISSKEIYFDGSKVKSGKYFSYITQESNRFLCFIAFGQFGDAMRSGSPRSRGNQDMNYGICYASGVITASNLEAQSLDVLNRAHFDGNLLRPMPNLPH